MAGKISEYTTEQTTLADTDRLDVSTDIGGTPTTEYLSWGSLKTQLGTAGFLSSGDVDLGYTASTRTVTNTGGDDVVLPLFTSTDAGLVPLSGGSATEFLSADGTFKALSGDGDGIYDGSGSLSGVTTVTMAGSALNFSGGIVNVDGGGAASPIKLYRSVSSGGVLTEYEMNNSVAAAHVYARSGADIISNVNGSEEGAYQIQLSVGGAAPTERYKFRVNGTIESASINQGIYRDSGSVTNGMRWTMDLNNSAGDQENYAAIATEIIDNTNGSEDGVLKFYSRTAGANFSGSNYGMVLGSTGLKIGTGTASAKLHVGGNTQIDGALTVNQVLGTSTFSSTGEANLLKIDGNANSVSAGLGNTAVTFDAGGHITAKGIARMSENSGQATFGYITYAATGNAAVRQLSDGRTVYSSTSFVGAQMVFRTGGNNSLTITDAGKFGFGNGLLAPTAKVQIKGLGTATGVNLLVEDSAGADKLTVLDNGDTTLNGNFDATTYSVNGTAGANFSGAVTNITVVDGIVTAVS